MFTSYLSLWQSDQIKAKPLNTFSKTSAVLTLRPITHVNKCTLERSEICKKKKSPRECQKGIPSALHFVCSKRIFSGGSGTKSLPEAGCYSSQQCLMASIVCFNSAVPCSVCTAITALSQACYRLGNQFHQVLQMRNKDLTIPNCVCL